ncbi:MAG: hypothetical protein OEO77_11275 [Acidimicrobiia bacterium]|nr:hypothetical protein [Acidimicrobiia bacterium]
MPHSEFLSSNDSKTLAAGILQRAWLPAGYTSPNLGVYPWQWMWDSCFHSIVWAWLDDQRAVTELESVFALQGEDGFVPHMGYQMDPGAANALWGREGASTITQPPMFGHALRLLAESGLPVSEALIDKSENALEFLWSRRRDTEGFVRVVHPWESGCDDSARWDAWIGMPGRPFPKPAWDVRKRELLSALEPGVSGGAVANGEFSVQAASFNALAAFNALELAAVTGSALWKSRGTELAEILDSRWSDEHQTWVDGDHASGAADTLEALLPVLVLPERAPAVMRGIDARFATAYGPAQTALDAPTFEPASYWRGPVWPHLAYLLWHAARRRGDLEGSVRIARPTVEGARVSGLAEYWNPETGAGLGAVPQSWTALCLLMEGVEPE